MTYSIVARDPQTGELGVAVQSHWFSVGSVVPWARAGIGAVASQANADPGYGPRALDLLAAGTSAGEALERLVAADPLASSRQVAVVDARGGAAAHTGSACIGCAGDVQGPGVSCQANIMASGSVWSAMLRAFDRASGIPLTDRLMAALRAAEAEGGDLRGRQSAAIRVVPAAGDAWETVVELRVEDHPDPLDELDRLITLDRAYRLAGRGDERVAEGRLDEAADLFLRAADLAPQSDELRFWAGLGAAQAGDLEAAVVHLRAAIEVHGAWRELLRRLAAEQAPAAAELLGRI